MDNAALFKKQANDAFRAGQFDNAIKFYTKAIKLIENADELAVIYSNRAQALLKMEKYSEALADADKSLEYNPAFLKSILRRGIANLELKDHNEAIEDFRRLFRQEPCNSLAHSMIKRILPSVKMSSKLLDAYNRHSLRRVLSKPVKNIQPQVELMVLQVSIFRALTQRAFLSTRNATALSPLLTNATILYNNNNSNAGIQLPCWFSDKWPNCPHGFVLSFSAPDHTLSTILHVLKPRNVFFHVAAKECARRFANLYDYAEVMCHPNIFIYIGRISQTNAAIIEANSKFITVMPYFPEIVQFKDLSFPKVQKLIITGANIPGIDFFKVWKEQQWKIKTVVVQYTPGNLTDIERFKGKVSEHVETLYIPLINFNRQDTRTKQLKQSRTNLKTFKRIFPSLNDVVGVVNIYYDFREFPLPCGISFKQHIAYLVDKINADIKPDYVPKLKVQVKFIPEMDDMNKIDSKFLKALVDECRKDVKALKSICYMEKGLEKFDWNQNSPYSKTIEMSTKYADFQLIFR